MYNHEGNESVENFTCFGTLQSRAIQARAGDRVNHQLAVVSHKHTVLAKIFGITPTTRPDINEGIYPPLNLN